jgi:protocatechuate 3,4-dioxygenase beta subunit
MSHGIGLFLSLALFSWAGPPPTPAAPATITSVSIIGGDSEPGTPLLVIGRVFAPDGVTPAPNVVVYAYQTDATGQYHNDPHTGVARLHGWAKTDADGRFVFRTIHPGVPGKPGFGLLGWKPGPYPVRGVPGHIHFHIYGGGYPLQWTPDLMFAGDALLQAAEINESVALGRFANIKATVRDVDGTESCTFNIRASKTSNYPPGEPTEPLR